MSYMEQSLSDGEKIEQVFHFHWFIWLSPLIWFFIGLLGSAFWPLAFLIGWPIAIIQIVNIKFKEQGLTNKRVVFKTGVISRRTNEMKLKSIETVEINQGIWGRLFGYGDIKVTGRGLSDLIFKEIDDPMNVKRKIEGVSNPAD